MLGEIYVAHPDRAWTKLQPLLATALGYRPVSLSATLTELLGIPAAYSPGVAVDKPIVGLVVDGDPPRAIVSVRMNSGAELLAALTTGKNPTHRARPLGEGRVTQLEPQRRGTAGDVAIGVCGNALLIAARGADLARYGPYVARELPSHPALREEAVVGGVPLSDGSLVVVAPTRALRGPVASRLGEQWKQAKLRLERQAHEQRRLHDGREPDFAEPQAVIAGADRIVQGSIDLLRHADSLTLVAEPLDATAKVRVALEVGKQGGARQLLSGLPAGNGRALLRLPRETIVALTLHSTESIRSAFGDWFATALTQLFGPRLGPADRATIEGAMDALGRGRGDELSLGLVATAENSGLSIQASVRDSDQLDRGVRGVFRALQVPAVAEPLAAFVGRPRVALDRVTLGGFDGPVTRARVVWTAPRSPAAPQPTQVLWAIDKERFYAATGPAADAILVAQARAAAHEVASLAADDGAVSALGEIQQRSVMTLLVGPRALGWSSGDRAHRPLVLSLGGTDDELVVLLELDHATLVSLAGSSTGLGFFHQ